MPGPSSISSAFSHDPEVVNLKILFANGMDIKTADYDILNKYVIHKFNQYAAANAKNFNLWDYIQVDFKMFEAKHFDDFDGLT